MLLYTPEPSRPFSGHRLGLFPLAEDWRDFHRQPALKRLRLRLRFLRKCLVVKNLLNIRLKPYFKLRQTYRFVKNFDPYDRGDSMKILIKNRGRRNPGPRGNP